MQASTHDENRQRVADLIERFRACQQVPDNLKQSRFVEQSARRDFFLYRLVSRRSLQFGSKNGSRDCHARTPLPAALVCRRTRGVLHREGQRRAEARLCLFRGRAGAPPFTFELLHRALTNRRHDIGSVVQRNSLRSSQSSTATASISYHVRLASRAPTAPGAFRFA